MQKILLAMNAECLNSSSIEFSCYLATKTKSGITAIFLEQAEIMHTVLHSEIAQDVVEEEVIIYENKTVENAIVKTNITLLEQACRQRNIPCSIRIDKGIVTDEMIKESRFADMIITDVNTTFGDQNSEGIPSRFVKELLKEAECPVIISPLEFDNIGEVVFAYDGSESSVFAIKQFAYLLPEFENIKLTLIQIQQGNKKQITESEKLKEWLGTHFTHVSMEVLHGDAESIFFSKYLTQKNKLLVMGAYGRKFFSSHSTADVVLKALDIPVFIAHL